MHRITSHQDVFGHTLGVRLESLPWVTEMEGVSRSRVFFLASATERAISLTTLEKESKDILVHTFTSLV